VQPDVSIDFKFDSSYILLIVYAEAEKGNRSTDEIIASLGRSQKTKFEGNKFHVNSSVIKEFFDPTVTHLISNVEAIVAEPRMKNVKTILLAGAFSESEIIYDAFQKQFKKTHNIIRPSEASLAVLKGAVMFGHMPNTIKLKIMSFTYGLAVLENPDYSTHSASKMVVRNKREIVDDKLTIFVRKDDITYWTRRLSDIVPSSQLIRKLRL
jgi:hypothetical protein